MLKFLLLTVVVSAVLVTGCGGNDTNVFAKNGRNLQIVYEEPVIVKRLAFKSAGNMAMIKVDDPSTRIAAVKFTVVNQQINILKLRITNDSVFVGNGMKGVRYPALSPTERALPNDGSEEIEIFSPILWGEFELEIGYQAAGWIFFEIPTGLKLDTLWWRAADEIIGRY